MKKALVVIGVLILLAAAGAGGWWFFNQRIPAAVGTPPVVDALPTPQLTYDGAYNGPMYTTSEKLGDDIPLAKYFGNLDRNGIPYTIIYFSTERVGDLTAVRNAIAQYPGRIIPFVSTGIGAQSEGEIVGEELTGRLRTIVNRSHEIVSSTAIKGLGEIEIHAWQMPHNDARILQLFDLAKENRLAVMVHPRPGETEVLKEILEQYPNTTFLIHLFRPDFERASSDIIALMQQHKNLIYTIDTDHLLFDSTSKIGLLYKYQDLSTEEGKDQFVQDFDRMSDTMLQEAVVTYKPLIDAVPQQVTVGTEMSADYTLEPEVYDRMAKFQRLFLGQIDPASQEIIAYKNALRIFGEGVMLP